MTTILWCHQLCSIFQWLHLNCLSPIRTEICQQGQQLKKPWHRRNPGVHNMSVTKRLLISKCTMKYVFCALPLFGSGFPQWQSQKWWKNNEETNVRLLPHIHIEVSLIAILVLCLDMSNKKKYISERKKPNNKEKNPKNYQPKLSKREHFI